MIFASFNWQDNLDELAERVGAKLERFGMADDPDFAADVQYIVGQGQMERAASERDPGFSPWAANDPAYAAAKGGLPVGVRTGRMQAPENMFGRLYVTRNQIRITYGASSADAWRARVFEATGRKLWGMDPVIRARLLERTREKLRDNLHGA